jgi:F-type H+-transporting ATPase subunit b
MLNISLGTIIWTTVAFLIVLLILKKMAWKPILEGLKKREESIAGALRTAEEAKEEMAALKASNEELLNKARGERDLLMKEAREVKKAMISEAKTNAKLEGDKMVAQARESIKMEKVAAMNELKTQVAALAIEVAEKVVKEKLSDDNKQKELVNNLIEEVTLN